MDSELEFYNNRISQNFDYPHTWKISRRIENIINDFKDIEPGTRLKDCKESLIGRIVLKRNSGKKLIFYTIKSYHIMP